MGNRIFISYRREDSLGSTGRIYDHLAASFGRDQIFMDVDAIQPGLDFVNVINSAVNKTDILIAVIGPSWLSVKDASGNRRLDNPEDFVRLEIKAALKRNIRVIPVLVEGALPLKSIELPDDLKLLARRNAIEISHSRFNSDVQRLVNTLKIALEGNIKTYQEERGITENFNTPVKSGKISQETSQLRRSWWQRLMTKGWFGVGLPITLLAFYYLIAIDISCANTDTVFAFGVLGFVITFFLLTRKKISFGFISFVIASFIFFISLPHGEFWGAMSRSSIFNFPIGTECQTDIYGWVNYFLIGDILVAFTLNLAHIKLLEK